MVKGYSRKEKKKNKETDFEGFICKSAVSVVRKVYVGAGHGYCGTKKRSAKGSSTVEALVSLAQVHAQPRHLSSNWPQMAASFPA